GSLWRRPHRAALWSAKNEPASGRRHPGARGRQTDPGLGRFVFHHPSAARRSDGASRSLRRSDRGGTWPARRRYRHDTVGLHPRPRPQPGRDLELLSLPMARLHRASSWLLPLLAILAIPGAAQFASAGGVLDRIAYGVDGAESSHGGDPGMWRSEPDGPQGPMQVSAAAAADVGGGDRFDETENRA